MDQFREHDAPFRLFGLLSRLIRTLRRAMEAPERSSPLSLQLLMKLSFRQLQPRIVGYGDMLICTPLRVSGVTIRLIAWMQLTLRKR